MPIPPITAEGLLPPGVHDATLHEIEHAFGVRTPRRQELFEKLVDFVEFAQSFSIFQFLVVDGSFVTDKDAPGDIDGVLLLGRADLARLLGHAHGLRILDVDAMKARYEVHLFFDPLPAGMWTDFFQQLRVEEALARRLSPGTRRGVLKVTL